jgi:signal transduction histidine kinase
MPEMPTGLFSSLSTLPRPLHIGLGTLMVLLLGLADFETGAELSLSIFYLFPVIYVTWVAGRGVGVYLSLLSASAWFIVEVLSGHVHFQSLLLLWNTLVRLTFFLLITYLLAELQRNAKRRRMLEKIFFHDILNLTGSIRGFAELLLTPQTLPQKEIFQLIQQAADKAVDEIEAQRILVGAERHDLRLEVTEIESLPLVELTAALYRHHKVGKGKDIRIDPESENLSFNSDQTLLIRVLGNLLKNALEATPAEGAISTGCRRQRDRIAFWVHNERAIPRDIQPRIFQEQVSHKHQGSGLGTYSVRILSQYLAGEANFVSDEKNGTTFIVSFPLKTPETFG